MAESIIFCIVFGLIKVFWDIHKESRQDDEARKQAENYATAMLDRMEAKKLTEYLMKEFQYKEQLLPEEMKSEMLLQRKMTRMMQDLHQHLHLAAGYTLRVRFDRNRTMDRAGQIDFVNRVISIFPRSEYTAETLMAVLAHETAHYFMYQYGIGSFDDALNEQYTDTIACLMGLSSYMVDGNVGYLKRCQFAAVRNSLLAYRSQHVNESRQQGQVPNTELISEQKRLYSQITAAEALLEKIHNTVRLKKVPSRTDLTAADYQRLKRLTDQLECGRFDQRLAFCKRLLNGNMTNVLTGQDDVERLCDDLKVIKRMFEESS